MKGAQFLAVIPANIVLNAFEDLGNGALGQTDVIADRFLRHAAGHQFRDEFFPVHGFPLNN